MAKYTVSGTVGGRTKFSIEVEAKSERHAERLAVTKMGSTRGAKATAISITGVKKG